MLGFGILRIPREKKEYSIKTMNFPQEGYTFAGLVAMMDPPKEGVTEAVA